MFNLQKPDFLSKYTDRTRRGSEYCPYCGGWHSSDAGMDECARRYSSVGSYRCPRCGQYYSSLDQANRCCEQEKRFERKYDPAAYSGYAGGYESHESNSWYGLITSSGREDTSASRSSWRDGYLNFGGGKTTSRTETNDSFFDSIFNLGGSNRK